MTLLTRPVFLRTSLGTASAVSLAAVLLAVLAACSTDLPRPYRAEVVQGNVVTQEMAAQLKTGQSRDQVRALLGSPMLADIFHADRWDYVFTIRRQGAAPQQRRVTAYFEANKLARFEASDLPTEREFVASIDAVRPRRGQDSLTLTDEQLKALPLPVASTAALPAQPASGPLRNYPPLEPLSR
jgi:outer membrane protein assembly factor BamE